MKQRLSQFGVLSRRRCARRDTGGCAVLTIGSGGPSDVAGRGPSAG